MMTRLRRAAEQRVEETATACGRHRDQVRADLVCVADDRLRERAFACFDERPGAAAQPATFIARKCDLNRRT